MNMPAAFYATVSAVSLARQAWAESPELRQYYANNFANFARFRLSAETHRPADLARTPSADPKSLAPTNTL